MKNKLYFQQNKILKEELPSFVPPSFKNLNNIKRGDTIKMMLIIVDNVKEEENREVFFANVINVEKKKGIITSLNVSPDTQLHLANINHTNTFRITTDNVLRCGKKYSQPILK